MPLRRKNRNGATIWSFAPILPFIARITPGRFAI
jgi:hypothetical protein